MEIVNRNDGQMAWCRSVSTDWRDDGLDFRLASISKTDFEDSLYKSKLHSSTLFARSDHFLMVKAPPFLGFELIQILEIECKNETYYLMFI